MKIKTLDNLRKLFARDYEVSDLMRTRTSKTDMGDSANRTQCAGPQYSFDTDDGETMELRGGRPHPEHVPAGKVIYGLDQASGPDYIGYALIRGDGSLVPGTLRSTERETLAAAIQQAAAETGDGFKHVALERLIAWLECLRNEEVKVVKTTLQGPRGDY